MHTQYASVVSPPEGRHLKWVVSSCKSVCLIWFILYVNLLLTKNILWMKKIQTCSRSIPFLLRSEYGMIIQIFCSSLILTLILINPHIDPQIDPHWSSHWSSNWSPLILTLILKLVLNNGLAGGSPSTDLPNPHIVLILSSSDPHPLYF